MGSIRGKAHPLPQTHTATVSTPVGRWNVTCMGSIRRKTHGALPRHTTNSEHTSGAMECYTLVRFAGKLTSCARNAHSKSQHSSGAMEEVSQTVQNANTHILRCQNHEHAHSSWSVHGSVQWGDECKFRARAEGEHTSLAVLSWILQPSKLATPLEAT